jgi:hypothetical protein
MYNNIDIWLELQQWKVQLTLCTSTPVIPDDKEREKYWNFTNSDVAYGPRRFQ